MNVRVQLSVLMIVLASLMTAEAKIGVPSLFGNDMVLQRGIEVPVWGWADPGEKVTVAFAGKSQTVTADDKGTWQVKLPAMKANAEPQTLTIGDITISNVLVGDVWLCSGQSNMEQPYDAKTVTAPNDQVRIYRVKKHLQPPIPLHTVDAEWGSYAKDNIDRFSAVGLHFGKKLQAELGVPIGLIDSSWSGSPIEPWISGEGYKLMGKPLTHDTEGVMKQQNEIIKNVKAWLADAEAAAKADRLVPFELKTYVTLRAQNGMYNGMIAPLVPYGIKGVVWYQGESNRTKKFPDYFEKLQVLIEGWRQAFRSPDMPFYLVQIAPFDYTSTRPNDNQTLCDNIWASQYKAAAEIKNSGVIPIHDTIDGNVKDIHPRNKKPVGERLAALALKKTYGKDVIASGPVVKSAALNNGKVMVSFDGIDQGLETSDGKAPSWFEVSADGKDYVAAAAVIQGNQVAVSSDKVSVPKFVRMGWSEIVIPNLRDKNGWPVFQFAGVPVSGDR